MEAVQYRSDDSCLEKVETLGRRVFLHTPHGRRFVGEIGKWQGRSAFIRKASNSNLLRHLGEGMGGYAWSVDLLEWLTWRGVHYLVMEDHTYRITLWTTVAHVLRWGSEEEHPPWGRQRGARLMDFSNSPRRASG